MPDELGEVEWDPGTQSWRRRLKRDPGKTDIKRSAAGLGDVARKQEEASETPKDEPDSDPDDSLSSEDDYKAKYGPLVGASKWRKSGKGGKKTSSIMASLGGPRA